MNKIIQYFKDCFKPPVVEKPISCRDQVAIRNLIHATRERIWMSSNFPRKPDIHVDYQEQLDDTQERILAESIKTVKELLITHHNITEDE